MLRQFLNYLKDEDGQTSTEYILLVAVVAVIIIKFKDELQTRLNSLLGGVFGKAQSELGGLN